MPKQYCPNCGGATDYLTEEPKFCSHCGKSYSYASAAQTILSAAAPKKRRRPVEEEEDFDEDDGPVALAHFPRKLDITISDIPSPFQKLEEIVNDAPVGQSFARKTKKVKHRSALEAIAERSKFSRIEIGGSGDE